MQSDQVKKKKKKPSKYKDVQKYLQFVLYDVCNTLLTLYLFKSEK